MDMEILGVIIVFFVVLPLVLFVVLPYLAGIAVAMFKRALDKFY